MMAGYGTYVQYGVVNSTTTNNSGYMTTASSGNVATTGGVVRIQYKYSAPTTSWIAEAEPVIWEEKELKPGSRRKLPDGSELIIDEKGNYRIEDKDAKITYRANNVRDFSPHLNASDMLAQFVRYVGTLGVRQKEVLGLPIELFINWLVIEAAQRDQDPIPEDVAPLPNHRVIQTLQQDRKPKCRKCGRFIPLEHHRQRFSFCSPEHAMLYIERLKKCPSITVPKQLTAPVA